MNQPVIPKATGLLPALAALLALAACGSGEEEQGAVVSHGDPLMDAALADQIMVDPDMINRNSANQAASIASADGALPVPDAGTEAAMAARAEAIALVGGSAALRRAPAPERVDGALPPEALLSVAARASAAGNGTTRDCAQIAAFSAGWAARMPAAFPVYPRGAVQEAAGTDANGCALRVVNFATAVAVSDVMDFYYTRAAASGFRVQHVVQDGENVLGGTKGNATVMVFARAGDNGLTTVDLVTSGQ